MSALTLHPRAVDAFRAVVWERGRAAYRDLPWRRTQDPYAILVSEVMLQQTQVQRVVAAYERFLGAFPTLEDLAGSSVAQVMEVWVGLGYNRRAYYLREAAREVGARFGGVIPKEPRLLRTLPGIGPSTAGAVAAFAYQVPTVFVETNIRAVFIAHFFPDAPRVPDRAIRPLVEATLVKDSPREWYWALMDYGAHLKATIPNPSRRSHAYRRQSPFVGSFRQVRGALLRALVRGGPQDLASVAAREGFALSDLRRAAQSLAREGLVCLRGDEVTWPDPSPGPEDGGDTG